MTYESDVLSLVLYWGEIAYLSRFTDIFCPNCSQITRIAIAYIEKKGIFDVLSGVLLWKNVQRCVRP